MSSDNENHRCPKCGNSSFESHSDMLRHHKLSHGTSIAMEVGNCTVCGDEFEYLPSNKYGIYCSECVEDESINTNTNEDPSENGFSYPYRSTGLSDNIDDKPNRSRSQLKGDIAEVNIISRLTELEIPVSTPVTESLSYDLVADLGERLIKVQVKHAQVKDGFIHASIERVNPSGTDVISSYYTEDEIDAYALYSEAADQVYWIWFDEAPKSAITLRFEGQAHPNVRWEDNYRIERVLEEYIDNEG